MPKITNKRDFSAGLMFASIGTAAMFLASGYRIGTPVRMGAGFFPMMLTGILIALGTLIMISALRSSEEAVPRRASRPLIIIPLAVAAFAVLSNTAGLFVSTLVVMVGSRFARAGHPVGETMVLAIGTAVVICIVFYNGLGLSLPLWPQFR